MLRPVTRCRAPRRSPEMKSRAFVLTLIAGAALSSFSSCGGGKSGSNPTPVATPTPAPQSAGQPTPAPATSPGTPRASPTPSDLAAGPVTQVKAYIKTIDTGGFNYRPGEQNADGDWIVHPGEFVVFDMTQRNGAGLICNWIVDPVWTLDDPDGVLRLKESSSPFFLRVIVEHKGHFEMFGEIDGIRSN